MVNGTCPFHTHVYDQEEEATCGSIAFTDMTQITLAMSGAVRVPKLSPQTMIDVEGLGGNTSAMRTFICSAEGGLEEEFYNPFINISRKLINPGFQTPPERRHRLRDIVRYKIPVIIRTMLENMYGDTGKKYPCVAVVQMCEFINPQIANDVAMRRYRDPVTGEVGALYRPSEAELARAKNQKEPLHALLVVGISTDHSDPRQHFCRVKNSHGLDWGVNGFSIIPLDFIRSLHVPDIYHQVASPASS